MFIKKVLSKSHIVRTVYFLIYYLINFFRFYASPCKERDSIGKR
jgi:hypothetical protein